MREKLYQRIWRPLLAFIYAFICIFDFVIMPIITTYNLKIENNMKILETAKEFNDSDVQQLIISRQTINRSWEPVTMQFGGIFHIAFGAILTGASITRTREQNSFYNYDHVSVQRKLKPEPIENGKIDE